MFYIPQNSLWLFGQRNSRTILSIGDTIFGLNTYFQINHTMVHIYVVFFNMII